MRLLDYFLRGGLLMWPLLACSVAAVAIVIERWLALRREPTDAARVTAALAAAVTDEGLLAAARTHGLCVRLLAEAALAQPGLPRERLEQVLDTLGNELVQQMQGPVDWLRAIAEVAPLLGFLGTVTGMIGAFDAIVQQGVTTPAVVAGGVSTALITTAGGLTVGIPAYLFHSALNTRLDRIAGALERVAQALVDRFGAEVAP